MQDVITTKKRFWMPRRFVDDYAAKITPYTQVVYMSLCRHADKAGFSFWGCRRIATQLGMNKDTVAHSINTLIASGLVRRHYSDEHKMSGLLVIDVQYETLQVSGPVGPKEVSKQVYKQESLQSRRTGLEGMKKLVETLKDRGENGVWVPRQLREQMLNQQISVEEEKPV